MILVTGYRYRDTFRCCCVVFSDTAELDIERILKAVEQHLPEIEQQHGDIIKLLYCIQNKLCKNLFTCVIHVQYLFNGWLHIFA